MMQADQPYPQPTGADDVLRRGMQQALAQTEAQGLEALQARVVLQWQQRTGRTGVAGGGPVAAGRAWTNRPWRVGLATLAIVAGLAVQTAWHRPDPVLEDLMEPDVLALISLGEL